ncbi:STAS domain-containing protein [Synechocystis sp. LKSZ1]|uniref:STAS domain-containing protein n=1 Tax=Synechocystis sp. LKSZ1 TaxID=3144951 RepID=UPI00336BD9C1
MANSIRVVEPSGIFDSAQAAEFCHDVDQLIACKVDIIIVDFKDVTFMDSSGLGSLVQALKITREAGVKLLLCSFNEQIKMLFELTGMERVFEVFTGREELEYQISQSQTKH